MAIKIVCDSTGGFSKEDLQALAVTVLPLSVNFSDGSTLLEGGRETYAQYYDRLAIEAELPTTSQPAVGDVQSVFSRFLAEGDEVIAICLSAKLSGTYNSFSLAAAALDKSHVRVVDCRCCSVASKFLARVARELIDEGASLDEVEAALTAQAEHMSAIMVVDDLKFLKKGGRVSNISFFVGKLLHIHPILIMKDGALCAHEKVRGMRMVFDRMVRELPDKLKYATVLHCVNELGAKQCATKLQERFTSLRVELEDLSPVIGTHLGNGSVGIIYAW